MKQKIESNPPLPNNFTTNMEGDTHSTIRFLGLLKQPDSSDPNLFELDECDVVWSSSDFSDSSEKLSHSPPTLPNSPTNLRRHHHQLHRQKSGLSAALSDDQNPLVRRKPTLNPSLSATSAARTILPMPIHRPEGPTGLGKFHQSAPVNVPVWPKKIGDFGGNNLGFVDEVDDDELEEEMVPPHVIVARSHVMTFSVFEGVGRTLKGRDLRRVRNAVFQKTDADYASSKSDRRSTSGFCTFYGKHLIYWKSKKQAVVSRLSDAAEYLPWHKVPVNFYGVSLFYKNWGSL